MILKPGTPCWLCNFMINTAVNGRVVEVVRHIGDYEFHGRVVRDAYVVRSAEPMPGVKTTDMSFAMGRDILMARRNLKPMTGDNVLEEVTENGIDQNR